jgi:hypothetical protein
MGVVEVLVQVAPARAGGGSVDVSRGERNGRVSSEWCNRPDDERYLSLDDLWANVKGRSERSRSRVVQTADIQVEATRDNRERRLWGTGFNDPAGGFGPNTTVRPSPSQRAEAV